MLKSFDIYNQNNIIKIIVALNLLLVGTASVLYTNRLIGRLEAREERYVQMYARTLAYVSQDDDLKQDLTFAVGLMADINANSNIPVIYINEKNVPDDYKNIDVPADLTETEKRHFLRQQVAIMRQKHTPIPVSVGQGEYGLIYFSNSKMLRQLQYFPLVQLAILAVLAILAYLAFSSSRRAEQNRVWVGLAKETAHQLGTPLSSLMAWVEIMRADADQYGEEVTDEIEKDVKRLETITARFSSIGSVPTLKDEDVAAVVFEFTDY
ncbi:MAG: histidine kinase, partial [Bacteroidetes bacterium]|nr:histidine kinase [Fibrella sp.]